jgi:hypothetical protein
MQWALSSDQIDMSIICKEAADKFIKYDKNFEIVDTVVQNSDVFLLKEDNPEKIGFTQNRNYQLDLIKQYYKDSKPIPFISGGLAYALESNKVDGIVVDAIKSLSLEGTKLSTSVNSDYDTYVLVVNKEFKNSKLYEQFIKLYNKSVKELNDKEIFKNELENYTDTKISDKDLGEFKKWKLKFLQIQK